MLEGWGLSWIVFQVETQLSLIDVLMSPIRPIITGRSHNPILARLKHLFRPVLCLFSPQLNSRVIVICVYCNIASLHISLWQYWYCQCPWDWSLVSDVFASLNSLDNCWCSGLTLSTLSTVASYSDKAVDKVLVGQDILADLRADWEWELLIFYLCLHLAGWLGQPSPLPLFKNILPTENKNISNPQTWRTEMAERCTE